MIATRLIVSNRLAEKPEIDAKLVMRPGRAPSTLCRDHPCEGHHLHLILPQRFFAHQQKSNGDRHMYASRTRFIPAAILDRFESCAWPETPATTLAAKKATDPVDITARLRRMWR